MDTRALLFRLGQILALIAIYDAVGGPPLGAGGQPFAIAAMLMLAGVTWSLIDDFRRRRRRQRMAAGGEA